MELKDIRLLRMTHIDNVPHILKHGVTHHSSANANLNYVPIGHTNLIGQRNDFQKQVVDTGEVITVGDYILFYFHCRMPMLYMISKGNSDVPNNSQESIVYLVGRLLEVASLGLPYYFSDAHAKSNLSNLYSAAKTSEIGDLLNWRAIKLREWGKVYGEPPEVKYEKQAEFLVKGDIPFSLIRGFICFNEAVKRRLLKIGVPEGLIHVYPNCYY